MKKILFLMLVVVSTIGLSGCMTNTRDLTTNMELSNALIGGIEADDASSGVSATFNMTQNTNVSLTSSNITPIRSETLFTTTYDVDNSSDEKNIALTFNYNGAIPINTSNSNTNDSLKYAYVNDNADMVVSFISYTEELSNMSGLISSKQYFLGTPYIYGTTDVTLIPNIDIEYDTNTGLFVFTITHDKLLANINSDVYSTEIIINSVDILIVTKADVTPDSERIHPDEESIGNYWENDSYNVVGKLDDDVEGTFDNYVGGISLINNGEEFEFIAPPTSLQASFNQYNFLKYNEDTNTIVFDDSHIKDMEDRFLPGLDQIKDEMSDILEFHNGLTFDEEKKYDNSENFTIKYNGKDIKYSDFFKGKITISESGKTESFEYEYDIENYELVITVEGEEETDSYEYKFEDSNNLTITFDGGLIGNCVELLARFDANGDADLHNYQIQVQYRIWEVEYEIKNGILYYDPSTVKETNGFSTSIEGEINFNLNGKLEAGYLY